MSSIGAKNLTYEDYLSLPETKQRYEIIDGVMLMAPGPTPAHQWFMQKIFINLINYVTERDLGVVLVAPVAASAGEGPRMPVSSGQTVDPWVPFL